MFTSAGFRFGDRFSIAKHHWHDIFGAHSRWIADDSSPIYYDLKTYAL